MLSAAHVLAMDAKNLLDVIDSLRNRYPELFANDQQQISRPPGSDANPMKHSNYESQSQNITVHSQFAQENVNEESVETMACQTYENMSQIQSEMSPNCELYANQSGGSDGLYDNECIIINQQMKNADLDAGSGSNGGLCGVPPPKPPVAAKPSNLQQKLKANLLASRLPPLSTDASGKIDPNLISDEPLKIVEEDTEMYSNTAAASSCANNSTEAAAAAAVSSRLPEPVPCAVVKESVLQKAMSNQLG